MPYGNNKGMDQELNKLKEKITEQRPDLNVDNMSPNDMRNILMNEINKNTNIDDNVKRKVNSGDIEGLKQDIINQLGKNKDANSEALANMLKNNDMEGLKNQLMGMLLGGMNQQKKNEINEPNNEGQAANNFQGNPGSYANPFAGLDTSGLMNMLMGKVFEGRKNDSRVILLNSMKPFLSDKRQKSIDDCIRVISMMGLLENFQPRQG